MKQKIIQFLAQFNITKHSIAVAYLALAGVYEADGTFSGYINNTALTIYHAFPHWLAAFVVGFVVPVVGYYHLGLKKKVADAAKTAATKTLAGIMILTLGFGGMVPLMGCTPATTTQAVKNIEAYLPTVKALADEGISIANLFDGTSASSATTIQKTIDDNIVSLQTIGNTYLAAPSSTNWQSVVNLVDALVTNADQQLLAAAKITDPTSQAKATAILGALDLAIHALDSFIQKSQPAATVQATAATRATKLSILEPYWPAKEMTPERIGDFKMAEAMGF